MNLSGPASRLPVRCAMGAYLLLAKPFFERLHLHSVVKEAYHSTLRFVSDQQSTLNVEGTEATFRTETVAEISYFADTYFQSATARAAIETEAAILEDILACLDEDDVVFDIGAHLGLYTCLAQNRLTEGGNVFAFEPYPPNYDSLSANISLNTGPAEAHKLALSDENGEVTFYEFDDRPGHTENALYPHFRGATATTAEARTGDSFLEDRGAIPNVIKIDVEGAELKVLEGLENALQHPDCRRIYCEVHPFSFSRHGGSHEDVREFLERFGFETTVLDRKGELTYWIRATRSDDRQ